MNVVSRFRYLILTVLLLALLVGLLVWLNETAAEAGAWRRVAEVARLVDEEALTFIHIPDINSAALSYNSSYFTEFGFDHTLAAAINHLAPTRTTLSIRDTFPHLNEWQSMNVQDFTATTITSGKLTFFHTNAPDSRVRTLIGKTWSPGRSSSTDIFSELLKGRRYHHFQRSDAEIIVTHEPPWHFIATNRDLLEKSLTRLQTQIPIKSLSTESRFEQALISLPNSYQALAYLRPQPASATETASFTLFSKFHKLQSRAIAITYTNESGLLREDFSILPSHPPTLKLTRADKDALQDQALALTSTHTLIYAAAPMGGHRFTNFLFRQFQNRWMAENLPDLHPIAEKWESGFEGSWAIMLEPLKNPTAHQPSPNGSMAAVLAFPLRNAEATRQALNILSLTSGSGIHESDTQTYTLDPALLPSALVNLLDDIHLSVSSGMLLVSDQIDGIIQVNQQRLNGTHLNKRQDFQRLSGRLPSPSAGLLFIDSQNIIRRSSEALRHPLVAATLWLGQRGQTTPPFDLKPWQQASSSEAGILPTLAVWTPTEDGYRQASLGTVSPAQWLLGVGAIMSSIDKTFLETKPNIKESFKTLPIEEELLEMIEP